jgi:hypothetical protein
VGLLPGRGGVRGLHVLERRRIGTIGGGVFLPDVVCLPRQLRHQPVPEPRPYLVPMRRTPLLWEGSTAWLAPPALSARKPGDACQYMILLVCDLEDRCPTCGPRKVEWYLSSAGPARATCSRRRRVRRRVRRRRLSLPDRARCRSVFAVTGFPYVGRLRFGRQSRRFACGRIAALVHALRPFPRVRIPLRNQVRWLLFRAARSGRRAKSHSYCSGSFLTNVGWCWLV